MSCMKNIIKMLVNCSVNMQIYFEYSSFNTCIKSWTEKKTDKEVLELVGEQRKMVSLIIIERKIGS